MNKENGYFIVLETFLDRFKVELYELNIKLDNLNKFLNSNTSNDNYLLLKNLYNVMNEYKHLLEKRVENEQR